MIQAQDVEKLAQLSRLDLSAAEKLTLQKDLESILAYVSELQDAPTPDEARVGDDYVKNVMRPDDANLHTPGEYSADLLSALPARDGDYNKVKKILG